MKDGTAKVLSAVHTAVFKVTGGLVGRRLVDNDMLLLTTTGRSTGRGHTVPLLYLADGDHHIVVASWGGRPDHPEWYKNLLVTPQARVQIVRRRFFAIATTLEASERATWWPRIVDAYEGYAQYQSRTEREIPVVRLTTI